MKVNKLALLPICIVLASCGGNRTFHEYARAGDTVAVPVGMQPDFTKDNITVTITPSIGADITYNATDPAIRGIVNLYPDPVSNMIVSREIGENTTPFAQTYSSSLLANTNYDKDYYQTTVFIDLPTFLPSGLTQVDVSNPSGISYSMTLDVIPGVGTPNTLNADISGGSLFLDRNMIDSLSRTPHTTVSFDSAAIPNAIAINFTHDPDTSAGGSGKAFVVNPLGYMKNLHWFDDGVNLKVILTESQSGLINDIKDYKFYVAGTITNLQLQSVTGYDLNGNEIPGVTGSLTTH